MSHFLHLPYAKVPSLLANLKDDGYDCIAPQVRDNAIVYDELEDIKDLPWGYVDEQSPGYYQTKKDEASVGAFDWSLPVQSVKPLLFKAKEMIWKVERNATSGKLEFNGEVPCRPTAVFGIRPCDLHAIEIQDKVFVNNSYHDPYYTKRRENLFLVAMNCTTCHSNCFCLSVGGSPRAKRNYDLAMIEIKDGFLVEIGSEKGRTMISNLNLEVSSGAQTSEALAKVENAVKMQTKSIPVESIVVKKLVENMEHPQWDDVAERCMSCGSCTQACPTCFCHTQKDYPKLDGKSTEHSREWDSCFSIDHSYTHGELYRADIKSRYRQWLTHKFSTWHEQFQTGGCVGCGRCITWCPVKIDVTDEINAICKE